MNACEIWKKTCSVQQLSLHIIKNKNLANILESSREISKESSHWVKLTSSLDM